MTSSIPQTEPDPRPYRPLLGNQGSTCSFAIGPTSKPKPIKPP
ncbi:MAG: hypothetical protein ACRC8Y_17280 [Chroococcales cyanobacterium]